MSQIPSKEQIRQWITDNPGLSSKRDIAKAFGVKADERNELKRLLREMEAEGDLAKRARRFLPKGELPPVALLKVLPPMRRAIFSPKRWRKASIPIPAVS